MEIDIPVQMTIRKNSHHLQITRTWFEIKYVLLAPFAIAWDLFIFLGYKMTLSESKVEIPAILFLLTHSLLGIILTYGVLAGFINKTTINVTPNVISVKHSPFPFWRNKRIASGEIRQLFCKMVKMRNGLYWQKIISVHAVTNNQSTFALLNGLKTVEQALFIKQEVHGFLNIKNASKEDELNNAGKMFF